MSHSLLNVPLGAGSCTCITKSHWNVQQSLFDHSVFVLQSHKILPQGVMHIIQFLWGKQPPRNHQDITEKPRVQTAILTTGILKGKTATQQIDGMQKGVLLRI